MATINPMTRLAAVRMLVSSMISEAIVVGRLPIDFAGVQFSAYTGELSLDVMITPVLLIFAFAMAVSILPGIRAARVTPTEAMRST